MAKRKRKQKMQWKLDSLSIHNKKVEERIKLLDKKADELDEDLIRENDRRIIQFYRKNKKKYKKKGKK